MTLCYNTVSDSLLTMLKKLMSAEMFSSFIVASACVNIRK